MVTVMRPSRARVRKCNDTTPRARCPNCLAPGAGGAVRQAPASTDRRPRHAPACCQELSAMPLKAGLLDLRIYSRGLARRLIALRKRAVLVMLEGERPHLRHPHRHCRSLHDTA